MLSVHVKEKEKSNEAPLIKKTNLCGKHKTVSWLGNFEISADISY